MYAITIVTGTVDGSKAHRMIVGVVSETFAGENRVAIAPTVVPLLIKSKLQVVIETGAGMRSGFSDDQYTAKGATIAPSRGAVFEQANVLCHVRLPSANFPRGRDDLPLMRSGQTAVGLADPLSGSDDVSQLAATGARCFALELLPRITRAQSMDVLSSQATIAGYKAVLLAATHLPRMLPMMMTAAGTIPAAKVLVIGAGVAGLQAIATARKLGAVVTGYDVRPVVKEQVESLGAKFLEIALSSALAEGQGGYAKAMDDEFYRRQRELMSSALAHTDMVITTAAVPGAKSPVLITRDMLKLMPTGSVIIDLAARSGQTGGNCEATCPDEIVIEHGVNVLGPTNLPAAIPQTASQLFARNIATFLQHIIVDGQLKIDLNDQITTDTLLCERGEIVNARVRCAGHKTPAPDA